MSALKDLGEMEPVWKPGERGQPVRRVMDTNAEDILRAAAKGYPASKIVEAFLTDFPELRSSRPDLDDAAYREYVTHTYASFRRTHGISKAKSSVTRTVYRPKEKAVEGKSQAAPEVVTRPVPEPEKPAEKPVEKPTFVKPSTKGFTIPRGRDL